MERPCPWEDAKEIWSCFLQRDKRDKLDKRETYGNVNAQTLKSPFTLICLFPSKWSRSARRKTNNVLRSEARHLMYRSMRDFLRFE